MFGRKARRIQELENDNAGLLANVARAKSNIKRMRECMHIADSVDIYDAAIQIREENASLRDEVAELHTEIGEVRQNFHIVESELAQLKMKTKKKVVKRKK